MLSKNRIIADLFLQSCLVAAIGLGLWYGNSILIQIGLISLLVIQAVSHIQLRRRYYGEKIGGHLMSFTGIVVGLIYLQFGLNLPYVLAVVLVVFGFAQAVRHLVLWVNRPKSFWDI